MDLGNGSQAFADSTGRPVPKPASAAHLSSPPSLMSPDRYEFYTFNDAGDLVKRLMTMDEIQGLIAGESVEIGSDLPGIDPEEVQADHVEERPPAFFFLPHPMEKNPDWAPPGVDKVVKRVQDVLADVQNKITTEEHQQPSWAIDRPVAHDALAYPTQNIPGSTLQFLKNPVDKINTFVPPSYLLVPEKPSTDESDNVDKLPVLLVDEQVVAPSSTPTLAPVSQTFEPSSTTNFVKISSSQVPISTTLSSTTTLTSTSTPAAPVTVKKTAPLTTAFTSTAQTTASPTLAQTAASPTKAQPTATPSTTTRVSTSESTMAEPLIKLATTAKYTSTQAPTAPTKQAATTQFTKTQPTTPRATTTQATTTKRPTTQATTTKRPPSPITTTQSPRPQSTTATVIRTTKPTVTTPLLRISTFANTPPPTTTSTTVGVVESSSLPPRSTTTEKSTTSKLQFVSTTDSIKENVFEKIPEISVKLPTDQSVIKIPSTIIADLLIEDQQEVIRHDSLSTSTSEPESIQSSTSKTTQKPTTASATSRPPSPVVSSIKLSSSEKVQGHYITSTSSLKATTIKNSPPSTPQPVTMKHPVSSSAAPVASSTVNIVATAIPKEKLTTADIKLTTLLMNAMQNNAINSLPLKSSTMMPIKQSVPVQQAETSFSIPIVKPEQVLEAIKLKTVAASATYPSTTPMTFKTTTVSTPVTQKVESVTIKPVLEVKKKNSSVQNNVDSSTLSNTASVQKVIQKTTLPPLEDFRVQMDQITQALTDKKPSSVKPLPMSTVVTKKPALAFAASTFASFGSSVSSNFRQTGKTTPPPSKTTQRLTTLPSTKVTLKPTTMNVPTDSDITTDSYMFETQMTTLNLPPAADSLILEDATSKTSEFELNSPDSTSEDSHLVNDIGSGEIRDDETDRFESTEKLESHDVVPFLSQLYDIKQTNYESNSSEEKSTENSSSSEEDVTDKIVVAKGTTTQRVGVSTQSATTTYVKVATKSPTVTTTEPPRVSQTSMNAKSTTRAPTTLKASPPTYDVLNHTVVSSTPSPNTSTAKPIVAQNVSNGTKLHVTQLVQGSANTNKTQNNSASAQQTLNSTGAQSSALNDNQENDSENLMLISTTEFSVRPNTLKHASTVRIDTKGQSYTHGVSTKPGNMVDKNNFKEVLDHLLAPAGILNFGDSSEESMKEDIYTTFIPASTTVKNTTPHVAEEKVTNNTFTQINKNVTSPVRSPVLVNTSSESTTSKVPQMLISENKVKPTTISKPVTPTLVKVTTEKFPDLEVSWQEPPEVVWTAEKASTATKKPATNVKFTTTRPAKLNQTATKPTESTTKKTTTNMELQSEYTKSNEDGMELIAVSDKTKTSTPSFGVKPSTNRPIQSIFNLRPAGASNLGLEATTVMLDEDIRRFIDLNNDIAIRLYKHTTSELDTKRSIAISPFGATSLIGMVFIGTRGQTSAQINDFLPFDDMITFNPHLVMRNITDSVIMSPELRSAAIVRQLYSQKVIFAHFEYNRNNTGQIFREPKSLWNSTRLELEPSMTVLCNRLILMMRLEL